MSSLAQLLMGYDAYGNAREWREMIRLESRGQSAVKNKVLNGVKSSVIKCDRCGRSRVTLMRVDDGYLCNICYKDVMSDEVSE